MLSVSNLYNFNKIYIVMHYLKQKVFELTTFVMLFELQI